MKNLENAIICDIDDTLAYRGFRESLKKYIKNKDEIPTLDELSVVKSSLEILKMFKKSGYHIIFVSVRIKKYYELTNNWLKKIGLDENDYTLILNDIEMVKKNGDNYDKNGNRIKSYKVKSMLYDKYVKEKYNVLFALEDDVGCTQMWRYEKGLICFQINEKIFPQHTL